MLESGFLTELMDIILQRINTTSKLLQSSTLDVYTAAFQLHSLKGFIESLRTEFSLFEKHGMMLSKIEVYKEGSSRKKKQKVQFDERLAKDECSGDPGQIKFRRNVLLPIIDNFSNGLIQRADAYSAVCAKLVFLTNLTNLCAKSLKEQSENVRIAYSGLKMK